MRNLTKTLAVVSLLAPASGHPLGIGDIKLHSALNQNLNAEISLVLSPGEKVSDIKVNLASSDKFVEAGVPWGFFLSKLKFETVTRSNGSVFIKVSSREALKEPVLDLLLEVSWPKGNLYREFTILVDPPSVYEQATVPAWDRQESYDTEEEYAPSRQTVSREPESDLSSAVVGSSSKTTGKNDTLWSIAEQASRGRDVSIEQMMLAIYKQNPRAFYKQNINALSAGKTLKIPERQVILKFSRKQALAQVNRQNQDWKNSSAATSVATPASTSEESANNQLTLAAPAEATVAENVVVAPENEQVTTEKKTGDQSTGVSESVEATESEVENKEQGAVSNVASADAEIKSKMAELEKQLVEMQKALALKDQQLATLQNQPLAKTPPQEQAVQATPPVGVTPITPPAEQPTPTTPGQAAAPTTTSGEVVTPSVPQEKPVQTTPPGQTIAPPAQQPPVQEKPVAKPIVRPMVKPTPKPEDSSNLYYIGAGGIGFALLTLAGIFWLRKTRSQSGESSAYSGMTRTTGAIGGTAAPAADGGTLQDLSAIDENFFLNDFSPGDFDIFDIDQGEIDPVSEADVYLAYGRYQQAEELMRDAIKEQPDRDECKLKLLEIYYSKADKHAFETYARELAEAGKIDDQVFWERVTEMGNGICPDSKLFASGKHRVDLKNSSTFGSGAVQLAKTVEVESEGIPLDDTTGEDADLAAFDSSFRELFNNESMREISEQKDNLSDFDLTDLSSLEDKFDNESQNNQSLDFDLGDFASDTKISNETQKNINAQGVEDKDLFESYDFDFSSGDVGTKKGNEVKFSAVEDASEEYHRIDFSSEKPESKNNLDKGFEFDFDVPTPTRSTGQGYRQIGSIDLTEMDEMETKLDLAMAYIDMGDTDSAKEIAREVLEKGAAEQKVIAQALLDDLG